MAHGLHPFNPQHLTKRMRWLQAIVRVHTLPRSAARVAVILADYISRASKHPSQPQLAAACSISERHLRDILRSLSAAGFLTVKAGDGRGHPSEYTFMLAARGRHG